METVKYEVEKEWTDVFKKIDEIGETLRNDAIKENFNPQANYKKWLNILTGCYIYLVPKFKKWRALKENNSCRKYLEIKQNAVGKFVSAPADREASGFVHKERYFRDLLEGWMLAAEQGIYTLKKHLRQDEKEEQIT